MGSQRRMAEAIMEKYLLDEDTAWERVHLLEAADIGDDLSDAVAFISGTADEYTGKSLSFTEGLACLKAVHDRISLAIEAIEEADWPPRRRSR